MGQGHAAKESRVFREEREGLELAASFKIEHRRKIQKDDSRFVKCHGSQAKSWFPEGGNGVAADWPKTREESRISSMAVLGGIGRAGSVEGVGERKS